MVAYDGERTEDDYFRGWKLVIPPSRLSLESLYIKSGGSALKAVEAAVKRKRRFKDYAEFWCVCDVDDTSSDDVARAQELARVNDIKLCLSNRCFEVWILLHYEFSGAAICNEKDAIDRVGKHCPDYGNPYKTLAFHELLPNTEIAIDNAVKLQAANPSNPMTLVHHLVRKLKQNCV
ncbi:RloB family protein [uncultured Sphingomonas sp.]|uniref:RloB family protein n=1 Tax=uncultured Sphingomonas sp. TaxID=158754 RepID=UPI0035CC6570